MAARTDTTASLSKIEVPSLIICGEHDTFSPPAIMSQLAEQINKSQFVVIPEAGHLSPYENPKAVNQSLITFLRNS